MSSPSGVVAVRHQSLTFLRQARERIEKSQSVAEVKEIRDKAEALRIYAKQAKDSLAAQNQLATIKLMAERRAGKLLARMRENGQRGGDGRPRKPSQRVTVSAQPKLRLDDLSISRKESSRWQREASVPTEKFDAYVKEATDSGSEITQTGLLKLAGAEKRIKVREDRIGKAAKLSAELGKFNLIYADPPWEYEFSAKDNWRVENHYPTVSTQELSALRVNEIADENSVLLLWATAPKCEEALQVMRAWGFSYRTQIIWDKGKMGEGGYYAHTQHEVLLIGKKGALPVPAWADRPRSVIRATAGKHSEKPEVFYEIVERMYPKATKIELFARKPRKGWARWGNEM